MFGCSHHSRPWKKRCVCPEDESCNWEKHPRNKETADFCFEITDHSHVFDYKSVILLLLLLLYLIHKQCCMNTQIYTPCVLKASNFILKCSYPDQVCDDTLSLSHCPVSPYTTGIITAFAEHWCHQSSKPTSQTSLY